MKPLSGSWLSASLGHIPNILILVLLAGILVWGHVSDWKLPAPTPEKKEAVGKTRVTPDPTAQTSADPTVHSVHLLRIEFPSTEAVANTGLATATATARTMAEQVVANGVLAFDHTRYVRLASRAAGTVWRVEKQAGDSVGDKDVLALVDSLEVGKAKGELLRSLVQHDVKRQLLERMRSAAGAVPDRHLWDAEAGYREARVGLLHDWQALANLGLPVRLEDLAGQTDDQVFNRLRVLGLPEPLQKETESKTGSAGLLPLLAPFNGQVIRCSAVRGEVVGTAQTLFVVAATDPLWALLEVRPEDAAKLRSNQPVTFQPDSDTGEPVTGNLSWISAEADAKTRTVTIRASVPNPKGRLRPNTFGTGRIQIHERPRAVVVPAQAVQLDGKTNLVFVRLGPTIFQARQVELGLRDGDEVEIRSGILPGDVVVTVGSHVLKSELRKDLIVEAD